jgi:tetratricopeptide (TPR) repeat protein
MRRFQASVLVSLVLAAVSEPASANPASASLRTRAVEAAYNLDFQDAASLASEAIAADSNDAAAYRASALITWLQIVFARGSVTVDEYLGSVSKPSVALKPPPPALAARFHDHINRATQIADALVSSKPSDPDAHYQAGAAVGLLASYTATVDGRIIGAFRSARRAYDEHERVLTLDPKRRDAGLIVGTYRYLVSTLSLPMRLMAYVVGFGGDKDKGLKLVEDAAQYSGETTLEAQLALVLLYNRERNYDAALAILTQLRQRLPRNRILWLETGATLLRANRPAEADRILSEGITKLASDGRPKMFGEVALWHYKRGAARVRVQRYSDAQPDLKTALAADGRPWVQGRAHTELARIALALGDRATAQREIDQAIRLADADEDSAGERQARAVKASMK